jgi:predicted negative regulator of RcsB-dependent stress response
MKRKKQTKLELLKNRLSKVDWKWIAIALLVIGLLGQSFYFQLQINKQIASFKEEQDKRMALATEFDTLKTATIEFYQEYQESGDATLTSLFEAIKVYDENVDIYNDKFEELYNKTDELIDGHNDQESRLNKIEAYLLR